MANSSVSEGEIIDSEGEKAHTSRPRSKDTAVDRESRPRSPLSRSSRPLQHTYSSPAASDSLDYGDDVAHFRHDPSNKHANNGYGYGYGYKRRHEDDRADARRFPVRYEDEARGHNSRSGRYASGRYDDREPPGKRHQAERYHQQRRRSRSRDGGRYTGHAASSRRDRPRDGRQQSTELESTSSSANQASFVSQSLARHGATEVAKTSAKDDAPPEETAPEPVVVDEAKMIEERRKKREALRAKHRGQDAPLLQKALQLNTPSQPTSPPTSDAGGPGTGTGTTASGNTPVATSPSMSLPASPGSPALFSVTDDQELANPVHASPRSQSNNDAPSAADYDPAMDTQEVRLREQQIGQGTEASAREYDETADAVPLTQEESKEQPKEFDMFADDDDDDMFATGPTDDHKKPEGARPVRLPEAKQLDRNMLDDWDDPEGYYRIILGELIDGRYHVQTNLGKGVFSAVVRALDTETERVVAIKIIRKQESMYKAGLKEIETLEKLNEADPDDKKHIIRLERHFEHKGHLCMVFENLSINLREVLKKFGRDIGINIKAVRSYAQQMFLGLALLRKCGILHADLKPDNVLVNEARSQLKIADLGSAMPADENELTDILVSRFYRAPEIMLGIRHDYAIDMWSIGCTLFELYTGKICFTGPSNNQMLKAIIECRGKIPNRMLKKAEFWAQHYDPDGTFLSHEYDSLTRKEVIRPMSITRTIPAQELKSRLFGNAKDLSLADAKELNLFVDLLDKCLAVDPARRISPLDALKHPFIHRSTLLVGK